MSSASKEDNKIKRERRNAVPNATPTSSVPEWVLSTESMLKDTPWASTRKRRNVVPNALPTTSQPMQPTLPANWTPSPYARERRKGVSYAASPFVFSKEANVDDVSEYMKSLNIYPKSTNNASKAKKSSQRREEINGKPKPKKSSTSSKSKKNNSK